MRAAGVRLALAALAVAGVAASARAQDGEVTIGPQARKCVDSGLAWLAKTQNSDGSWNTSGYGRATACTSLAGLAFLSDGHLPGRGAYGENVSKALDYVLASSQPSGLLEYGLPNHAMYSHGYSTLFLAEAWGTTRRPDIRDKLKNAVELIIRTQNREGGWRYLPKVADADLSVTVTQIVALRAAANAGVAVPRETIDRAIEYLKRSARPDGGFSYQPGSGPSNFARAGAGLVSLLLAGERDAPEVQKAVSYLFGHRNVVERFYYYGHYYAAQGMHLLSGTQWWPQWYAHVSAELARRQRQDGPWTSSGEDTVQSTAMAILVLTIPNGYLPIYQR